MLGKLNEKCHCFSFFPLFFGDYGLYDVVVLLFHFEVLKGSSIIFRHEIYITGCLGSFGLFRSTCYFIMHWIESGVNKNCVRSSVCNRIELYKLCLSFQIWISYKESNWIIATLWVILLVCFGRFAFYPILNIFWMCVWGGSVMWLDKLFYYLPHWVCQW